MGPHLTYSYVHGGRWKVGGSGLGMPRMLGPQAIARPFACVGCGKGGLNWGDAVMDLVSNIAWDVLGTGKPDPHPVLGHLDRI